MNVDDLRALLDHLCELSDDPANAIPLRAAILACIDWHRNSPQTNLTREECAEAAAIAAWLEWKGSQKENIDWQTSETKTGKPGLTH